MQVEPSNACSLGLGTHLFVKVPRSGDSDVTSLSPGRGTLTNK